MKGYCLVSWYMGKIYTVELIPDVKGIPPVDVIKNYCREYGVLPFPVDFWDEHEEEILWFVIRDGERLKKIEWPDARNNDEALFIYAVQIQVYRAFETTYVDCKQALEALDNPVITRALGLGWGPQRLGGALGLLANAMEEREQAEAYRENIMDMIEDVSEAVDATESIYEESADEFLEEEGVFVSGPKAPKDMTAEELINEATQLHKVIFATESSGVDDLLRFQKLEAQLIELDYEIRIGSTYSVQKREEE